jgi:hypothetical protein
METIFVQNNPQIMVWTEIWKDQIIDSHFFDSNKWDHNIAQAVSHWLHTAAVQVQSQVKSCGICSGQSGAGAGFLIVLQFPLPTLTPPTAPQSSSIIWGWYNRPDSGQVKSVSSHLKEPEKIKSKN